VSGAQQNKAMLERWISNEEGPVVIADESSSEESGSSLN